MHIYPGLRALTVCVSYMYDTHTVSACTSLPVCEMLAAAPGYGSMHCAYSTVPVCEMLAAAPSSVQCMCLGHHHHQPGTPVQQERWYSFRTKDTVCLHTV